MARQLETWTAKARHKKRPRKAKQIKPIIGWREFVALPDLGIERVNAKIDTGARTSAIHAWNIRYIEIDGAPWATFDVHPLQRNNRVSIPAKAPVLARRQITSSSGHMEDRFVVTTSLRVGEHCYPIELTLTNRDAMGFRLLLGRTAFRRKFLIDAERSYLTGRKNP